MKNDKIDYKEFIKGIRVGLTRQKVLARTIMQEVDVDEKNVKAYYDAHLNDYTPEELKLQHVFVSSRRKNAAEARAGGPDRAGGGQAFRGSVR